MLNDGVLDIFPIAYLPPFSYIERLYINERHNVPVFFDVEENFVKQSFRNRCTLLNTNGNKVRLTIPLMFSGHGQKTKDVKIAYFQRWQHQHWQAIKTIYNSTPYFFYYEDFLQPMYTTHFTWLVDFVEEFISIIMNLVYNNPLEIYQPFRHLKKWSGLTWTRVHQWQDETSILHCLCEYGPQTLVRFKDE